MHTDACSLHVTKSAPMPPGSAGADDFKRWMAVRLGLPPGGARYGDSTMREAFSLWCAVVDSLVWQRERQGARLDLGSFVLALQLPALQRRADDGDQVLAAYLVGAAGAGDGQAVLYRARHPYIASFVVGELVKEAEHLCENAAAPILLRTQRRRTQGRRRAICVGAILAAGGGGLVALATWGSSSVIAGLLAAMPAF